MRTPHKGFTLIEILVVVVVVAVLMAAVTFSFPVAEDKLLKENAQRLSALIGLARDEAILQSREIALEVNKAGYSFYRNEGNSWVAYSEPPFVQRKYPADLKIQIYLEGVLIDLDGRNKENPQIVILSSGEMTPFTYKMSYKNKIEATLKVSAIGQIEQTFIEK